MMRKQKLWIIRHLDEGFCATYTFHTKKPRVCSSGYFYAGPSDGPCLDHILEEDQAAEISIRIIKKLRKPRKPREILVPKGEPCTTNAK